MVRRLGTAAAQQFHRLIEGLGGAAEVLEINRYKHERASMCLVLPPVGSASSAIHLIECIEQFIGSRLFGNRQIQLQLCSPGRLGSRASALLGISFYLGSDTLRRYTQADLRTTFSSEIGGMDLCSMMGRDSIEISLVEPRASPNPNYLFKMGELIF